MQVGAAQLVLLGVGFILPSFLGSCLPFLPSFLSTYCVSALGLSNSLSHDDPIGQTRGLRFTRKWLGVPRPSDPKAQPTACQS